MTLDLIKDSYDRKARLYPVMLVVLPVAVTVGASISVKLSTLESAAATLASCGVAFLMTQLASDMGRRKEAALFATWEGMPSVAILRHRDQKIDQITKRRYHKKLSMLVEGTEAPTKEDETANPRQSDAIYKAWCTYLRTNTRDTKTYGLLFQENVSYGYRRNVWGMKPLGVITSGISLCVSSAWVCVAYVNHKPIQTEIVLAFSFDLFLLAVWGFVVSPEWVRIKADVYAARLTETIEHLQPPE